MKWFTVFFLVLLLGTGPAFAQPSKGIPYMRKVDIPDCEIVRTAHFDGNSLWGYINGGADVFLEYGFQSLMVQEVTWKGLYFKVEVYKMYDPEAAFGIFSINRYQCDPDTIGHPYTCQIPYHLQMAYGKFYISIINHTGSEKAAQLSVRLARSLMKQVEPESLELPSFLEEDLFKPHLRNMYLFRGAMGMSNRQGPWNQYFEQRQHLEVIIIPLSDEDREKFLAMIRSYKGEKRHFDEFISYLGGQEEIRLRTWHQSNRIILLFGGKEEDENIQQMHSLIDRSLKR